MDSSSFFFSSDDVDDPHPISFAPNMTEASFTTQQEPDCPDTPLLFPPIGSDPILPDSSMSFKRLAHCKKKDAHIPRPPNAFILFRSSFIKQQHIPGSIEGNHSQLSKIVGACWQRLSYEERQVWEKKAKEARAEHKRMYPDYRFIRSKNPAPKPAPKEKPPAKFVNTMPVVGPSSPDGKPTVVTTIPSPTKVRRKNHRTTEEDPRRCEQIAKFLVAGHKGSSLEAMVKQFDAEAALRQKPTLPITSLTPQLSTHSLDNSISPLIPRRSSSCPPLDISAAEVFRLQGPKTSMVSSGPVRRPKPLRAAATLPYPSTSTFKSTPTFKVSRSVSPPPTPSYLDTIATPIEGPFANSTFAFSTAMPNTIPRPASIAPKDMVTLEMSSPSSMDAFYPWSFHNLSVNNSLYATIPPPPTQSSVASAPVHNLLRAGPHDGHGSDTGWNSEFEWAPTEDEAGTSTAPPSTPEAPSPAVSLSRSLPLEEVAAAHANSFNPHEVAGRMNESLDLSEYAKGLQLFSSPQDRGFAPGGFDIPQFNPNDLSSLNPSFDHPSSDPTSLWQLQNIMEGIVPPGVHLPTNADNTFRY